MRRGAKISAAAKEVVEACAAVSKPNKITATDLHVMAELSKLLLAGSIHGSTHQPWTGETNVLDCCHDFLGYEVLSIGLR